MIIHEEKYTLVEADNEQRIVFVVDNECEKHIFSYEEIDEWEE